MKFVVIVLFMLAAASASAQKDVSHLSAASDIVLPDILAVSASPTVAYGQGFPGAVTRTIRSSDKSAFFYASIKILNPSRSRYEMKIECIDEKGDVLIEGAVEKDLFSMYKQHFLSGEIGQLEMSLGLDPQLGALVPGQRVAMKNDSRYFIRLHVDGKLVSLTSFRYLVLKGKSTK